MVQSWGGQYSSWLKLVNKLKYEYIQNETTQSVEIASLVYALKYILYVVYTLFQHLKLLAPSLHYLSLKLLLFIFNERFASFETHFYLWNRCAQE